MFERLKSQIDTLKPISLSKLESVALLNRVDSKYIVNEEKLATLFACFFENYMILEINQLRVFSYKNNYFDTPNLLFYNDHHNKYANRLKVRSRKYVETNKSFFEIKKKEKINRTNKFREKLPEILSILNDERKEIVQQYSRKEITEIEFILENNFKRITLVNNNFTERVTIDSNLTYKDKTQEISLGEIAIIEIKQSKSTQKSPLTTFLKEKKIRKSSISKYILGLILLKPNIKKNRFLPIIKKINNLNK